MRVFHVDPPLTGAVNVKNAQLGKGESPVASPENQEQSAARRCGADSRKKEKA